MKLRRILALMLLLAANAQVFAQEETGSLIACPDGKCKVEAQATLEEKQRETKASGKNLFCVDIGNSSGGPLMVKFSWREKQIVPGRLGSYKTNFIDKEELKVIETGGEHSIDLELPAETAYLKIADKNGKLAYSTFNLRPNICKKFSVIATGVGAEDQVLKLFQAVAEKEVTRDDLEWILKDVRDLLNGRSFHVWELSEEDVSQYAQNK